MKSYEILIDDWMRIFVGNIPLHFFAEIIFRVLFLFLLLIFSMRLMGKRMASQLSRNEMVAMSSLAAATGIPMQAPDRGLLPALIVAMIVVLGQRLIASIAARNEHFEKVSQGNIGILVYDGILDLSTLKGSRISRERVFAQLRSEGVKQLGEVSRLYFEANGTFTLVNSLDPKPGLSVLPGSDEDLVKNLRYDQERNVCFRCGYETSVNTPAKCPKCDHDQFVHPVMPDRD